MSKALYDVVGGVGRKVKKAYGVVRELTGYSEKNLLPPFAEAVTDRGITIKPLKDGGLHITGTVDEGYSMITIATPFDGSALQGDMYTFSMRTDTPDESGALQVRLRDSSGAQAGASNIVVDSTFKYTNVSSTYMPSVVEMVVRLGAGIAYDHVIYLQIEEGSAATEYEPYEIWEGIARKIKKSYDVVNGLTRQFFSEDFMT